MFDYDIIVIGGGPAGLTAALYSARAGKKVLILESNAFGGQIATAPRVENFPSAETTGAELADKMFAQATKHGADFDMGTATVAQAENGFVVTTEYSSFTAQAVVLATGVAHKKLGVEGEARLVGNGVCYCAVCDGAFYKDKSACVVGDGNSAVQYALYLADICREVHLLTMFDKLFCDKELSDRLRADDRIDWVQCVTVSEILGDSNVEGVVCRGTDGAISYIDTDAVFVAIGQIPNNDSFANIVRLDENGYIIAGEDCHTSCAGVFVAGDCRTKTIRQCATAVGDGAVAGSEASRYCNDR